MAESNDPAPRAIPATVLIHQEGVVALIALIGLALRDDGVAGGLAARGSVIIGIGFGVVAGAVCAGVFWVLRHLPALAELEAWQRRMVRGWSTADAAAVSLFSGLAEEALIRALLQPIIGLLPAALLFAGLHFVPERRLWLWPVLALVLGIVLGWIFSLAGYPAAAAAHIAINAFALFRLQRAEAR